MEKFITKLKANLKTNFVWISSQFNLHWLVLSPEKDLKYIKYKSRKPTHLETLN
jgi:hypothetical protein